MPTAKRITRNDRQIPIVVSGNNEDDRPAGRKAKVTPRPTHSKLAVTRVILAGGLARTLVLGPPWPATSSTHPELVVSGFANIIGFGRSENHAVQAAAALGALTGREDSPMEPQEADGGTNKEEDIWSESWEKKTIFKLAGLRDFRTAPDTGYRSVVAARNADSKTCSIQTCRCLPIPHGGGRVRCAVATGVKGAPTWLRSADCCTHTSSGPRTHGAALGPLLPRCLPAQNQLRAVDRQHRASRISGSAIQPGMLVPPSSQNLRLQRIGHLPHHEAKLVKPASRRKPALLHHHRLSTNCTRLIHRPVLGAFLVALMRKIVGEPACLSQVTKTAGPDSISRTGPRPLRRTVTV